MFKLLVYGAIKEWIVFQSNVKILKLQAIKLKHWIDSNKQVCLLDVSEEKCNGSVIENAIQCLKSQTGFDFLTIR